ncbi:MAG: family 16 glycoside hydrolase [Verrucomicrobiota bacterium]
MRTLLALLLAPLASFAAEPKVILEEKFDRALSKDWFWGLGTWSAKDGVLRGFESGARRHGPVKVHKLPLKDGIVEADFRLVGKASFAGIIFNGSQERGHICHLVMTTKELRILTHPEKGENKELAKVPALLPTETWHHVRIVFNGDKLEATVDDQVIRAASPCIAEEKLTFGLGGESGGPTGEQAGALEFRRLRVTSTAP